MKKIWNWILFILVGVMISGCASTSTSRTADSGKDWQVKTREVMRTEQVTPMTALDLDSGKTVIGVKDQGDRIQITILNPRVTPKGNTKDDLKAAVRIKAASGILHAARKNEIFADAQVVEGRATFTLLNYGKAAGVPVVEHLWFYAEAADGTTGYVPPDPDDPWVVYETQAFGGYQTKSGEKADLETLAVGLVMYPDKPTVPLKSLGKGKLKQGRHPEL